MNPKKARKRSEPRFGYDGYLSPFTWRYGSSDMRSLFSEVERRSTWRKVWLALAEGQHELGLISRSELDDLRSKAGKENVDIAAAHRLEERIGHDLMAELRTFAAQAKGGGGKLHLGATSMDIEDNADMMAYRSATELLRARLVRCLRASREKILRYRRTACIAWTHLQPAEPTTLGYRFANYAQDLMLDLNLLDAVREQILLGKGMKGAVGTSASFKALLGSDELVEELEDKVMSKLALVAFKVSTQTYPRKVDYVILSCLGSIAQSCHKFGLDLRIMQSPAFGELSEPIADEQVGSSAMPFKRNPVMAERMCSIARFVSALPPVAFASAGSSILERTLDDSAAKRIIMPEAFLAVDECLAIYERLLSGLRVYPATTKKNLDRYGPFAGTEAVMMRLVKMGGDRQKIHELIRVKSFAAWEQVMRGMPNPIERMLADEKSISSKITPSELRALMDPAGHVGDAEKRCREFVRTQLDPLIAEHRVNRPGTKELS